MFIYVMRQLYIERCLAVESLKVVLCLEGLLKFTKLSSYDLQ